MFCNFVFIAIVLPLQKLQLLQTKLLKRGSTTFSGRAVIWFCLPIGCTEKDIDNTAVINRIRQFLSLQPNMNKDHHPPPFKNPFSTRPSGRNVRKERDQEMVPMLDGRRGTVLGNKEHTFEFSVRDTSDATAKRGFRVQVPKKILAYVIMVFFILPLTLFLYVEIHKAHQKRQVARSIGRNHSFNVSTFPHFVLDQSNMTVANSVTQIIHDMAELTADTVDQIGTDIAGVLADPIPDVIGTTSIITSIETSNVTDSSEKLGLSQNNGTTLMVYNTSNGYGFLRRMYARKQRHV